VLTPMAVPHCHFLSSWDEEFSNGADEAIVHITGDNADVVRWRADRGSKESANLVAGVQVT